MSIHRILIASLALAAAADSAAQTIDCAELRMLVGSAKAEFAPVRGKLQGTVMSGDGLPSQRSPVPAIPNASYSNEAFATTRPLQGAASCEIRIVKLDDDEASMKQAAYRCTWAAESLFGALRQSVTACLTEAREVDDTDPDAIYVLMDQVSSGEGERSLVVSVERVRTQGIKLAIAQTACLNRAPGGCDEDE